MRKLLLITVFIFTIVSAYSEEVIILEEKNIYGGHTIEHKFNEQEQRSVNYSKLIEYFNNRNVIVKVIFTTTNNVAINTGIKEQIQYYENRIIVQYEMFFTDEYINIHGFNRLTEDVNLDGVITLTKWYNNDVLLDVTQGSENKFQFFSIEFIEKEFMSDYQPNNRGDVFSISARYFSTRSVIKFDTQLIDLDQKDIILMRYFANSFGLNDISGLYTKKIKVYSENRSYWLFVQTQLIPFVKGQSATIMYYPIARNKELYLICVGFYDISN